MHDDVSRDNVTAAVCSHVVCCGCELPYDQMSMDPTAAGADNAVAVPVNSCKGERRLCVRVVALFMAVLAYAE
jgi:hypothetical protein